MQIREALIIDIPQIQVVRNLVKENILSNPNLVTDEDCADYITKRGKGWVAIIDETIVGFAIADLVDRNIWALFMHPNFENKGIGKQLHTTMLHWYFTQTKETVWLSTEPNSRAATFYTLQGWEQVGFYGKNELKFEMSFDKWSILII